MRSSRLALVACAVLSRIHVVFAALSQHTVLKVHGIARRVKVVACQHGDVQSWLEARGGKSSVSITTENGLRGLVSDVDAAVGDVLLEVPIDSVLCDADGSGVRLPGAAPSWAASLPSKVQLALQFIALKAAVDSDDWSPFVRSWPSSLPPLPDDSDVLALSLSGAVEGGQSRRTWASSTTSAWIKEQYELAAEAFRRADEAADATTESAPDVGMAFPPLDSFSATVRLVGSRCLCLRAGAFGERRFLVPVLDMANHDGVSPSAHFAFCDGGASGGSGSIQLVAARRISAGDAVTISYGEHTNAEFVLAYGFVPRDNPFDCEVVSLRQLLRAALSAGCTRAAASVESVDTVVESVTRVGLPTTGLRLLSTAPAEETVLSLRAALAPDGGAALAALLEAIAMDELDEDELDDDDDDDASAADCAAVVAAACATLEASLAARQEEEGPPATGTSHELLEELRASRVRLLRSLQRQMEAVATAPYSSWMSFQPADL